MILLYGLGHRHLSKIVFASTKWNINLSASDSFVLDFRHCEPELSKVFGTQVSLKNAFKFRKHEKYKAASLVIVAPHST